MIDIDLIDICAQENIMSNQFKTFRAFQVFRNDRNFEIVFILASINCETLLIRLISDAVTNFRTKHHLVAIHVVGHDVL